MGKLSSQRSLDDQKWYESICNKYASLKMKKNWGVARR